MVSERFSVLITVAIDVDGTVSAAVDQDSIPQAGTDPLGSVPKGTPFGGKIHSTRSADFQLKHSKGGFAHTKISSPNHLERASRPQRHVSSQTLTAAQHAPENG